MRITAMITRTFLDDFLRAAIDGNIGTIRQSIQYMDERRNDPHAININSKSYQGYPALILAAANGHTDIVNTLLDVEGIDINATFFNYTGKTALYFAACNSHIDTARTLLAAGADNTVLDSAIQEAIRQA